ncbi:MAG: SDR family NAD(P)-dependent oxidoreductase [Bacteroidota bacterium]
MALNKTEQQRIISKYGTWAIVTGASSGLGKALAEELAAASMNLILVARREEILNEIALKFKRQFGISTITLSADLSTQEGVSAIINTSNELDVGLLVTAAGFGTSGKFLSADVEEELRMLSVNCEAVLRLTHHFGQTFKEGKHGGIILFSSIVAFQGVPYSAHYAATKAYIQTLGEGLAVEWKGSGVDIHIAAPGPVKTGFGEVANLDMENAQDPAVLAPEILKALGRKTISFPGFLTKFLTASLSLLPRWGKVRVMKLVMSGMTNADIN